MEGSVRARESRVHLARRVGLIGACSLLALSGSASLASFLADTVPTDVQLPGTQPLEVPALTPPTNCDNCHSGYDELAVEPAHNWRGSMMAHASRDPLFWASVAIAEQDFDGSGDLCLRCHISDGWVAGRSTPTDGSGFSDADATGVSCALCHAMTDPDQSEHLGTQVAPFLAHDEGTPAAGYYGSGMFVLWDGNDRLGPYDDANTAPHSFIQSEFHRSVDFCGTCHDVSNPVVGDLAHNHGAVIPLDIGTYSGVPGAPVDQKAAFNNFPYQYGVVERTFSEYKASLFPTTPVSAYTGLPVELQDGSIEDAYLAATAVRPDGRYADGTERYFSCQTCHMPPVEGHGCKQNQAPLRADLPLHDMTGGNYWMPDVLAYMDTQGTLRLGGSLSQEDLDGLVDGKTRALNNLGAAAELEVEGDVVKVVNLTGHKLITGYPEGRRMWLNVVWEDGAGAVLREDGAYGALTVDVNGSPTQVESLLDLHDPHGRVYEAHLGMTQEWAQQLVGLGYATDLALAYDRVTGAVTLTLGDLAAQAPGTAAETLHFALNNIVIADNRIPPWGMSYDEAERRIALPVPDDQYGDPGPGGTFEHWDDVLLVPPVGAAAATIQLMYQPTSWEYVQFLHLANDGLNAFLGTTGSDLLDAWLNTAMAAPVVMDTETWSAGSVGVAACFGLACPCGNDDADAGCANSTGSGGLLAGSGSASVAADDLLLTATDLPPNNNGLFYMGDLQVANHFFDGYQCALGTTFRFLDSIQSSGSTGVMTYASPVAGSGGLITPGTTWYFHAWHRDVPGSPCGTGANLTSLLQVSFGP